MEVKDHSPTLVGPPPESMDDWKSLYIKVNGHDILIKEFKKNPTFYNQQPYAPGYIDTLSPSHQDLIRIHIEIKAAEKEGNP